MSPSSTTLIVHWGIFLLVINGNSHGVDATCEPLETKSPISKRKRHEIDISLYNASCQAGADVASKALDPITRMYMYVFVNEVPPLQNYWRLRFGAMIECIVNRLTALR